MAWTPPGAIPNDDASFQAMANQIRQDVHQMSDYLNTVVSYTHPMSVNTLKRFGLDGTNRFGFGSSAQKAADAYCDPLKRAAQNFVDGGQLVTQSFMLFVKGVWVPYQMAKKQMESGDGEALLKGAGTR